MIAILLSTFNGEKYLSEQIESILNQSFDNWKLYIRDDGSVDSTIYILNDYFRKYPDKISLYKDNKGNLGYKRSFMELLANINESYYMFCDQDDIWLYNKIEISYNYIRNMEISNPNKPLLISFDQIVVDKDLNIIDRSYYHYNRIPVKYKNNIYSHLNYTLLNGCSIIVNDTLKRQSLPYRGYFPHDMWLAIVCIKQHGVFECVNESYMLFRRHDRNVTKPYKVNSFSILSNSVLNFKSKMLLVITNYIEAKKRFDFNLNCFSYFYNRIFLYLYRIFILK